MPAPWLASNWPRLRRPLLSALAVVFAAATLAYTTLWMAAAHWTPPATAVELGFDADILPHEEIIKSVQPDSPAERAGLLPRDRIVAIDGAALTDEGDQPRIWSQRRPGDTVQLTVRRPGLRDLVTLTGTFRRRLNRTQEVSTPERVANEFRNSYPLPFVLVGLVVLFLRLEERRVWLLSLLLAGFASQAGGHETIALMAPASRPFVMAYRALFHGLFAPLFYCFCAVFPARSALDRRFPRLKWIAIATGLFLACFGLRSGDLRLPPALNELFGYRVALGIVVAYGYAFLTLGLMALAWTYVHPLDAEARRKIRVIFWGTALGVGPAVAVQGARDLANLQAPWWLDTAIVALLFLFPLSLAYAVARHRVLEIPILLKRSARYVLVQRGFTVLLTLASIALTLLFAVSFARRPVADTARAAAIAMGAVFGTALMWSGSQVHRRVSGSIDRAFFRSAYDARVILQELAEATRAADTAAELAHLLEGHVRAALQPEWMVVYFRDSTGRLSPAPGVLAIEPRTLPATLPLFVDLARRGRPWECPPDGEGCAAVEQVFAPSHPDCLAPMLGRAGDLAGLLVLGRRRSDEPYSGDDQRLLASVASQAGISLDNLRLAAEIAERLETERLAAREMEIAREVQARLLPQSAPCLKTLECAARCVQARSVGGDYYDFLRMDADHTGLVLGDVSGKGVHAALLMANLQALMRSLGNLTPLEPSCFLERVNRMLWESTASQHYATLFFGIYDDSSRRLIYANCGHNPPLWLRADGSVKRLDATATVLGLFQRWECGIAEVELAPGDVLAVYSDGITEAARGDEEFGEARLAEGLATHRDLPVERIVSTILEQVLEFSPGTQGDDLTLLVARGKDAVLSDA